MAIAMGSNLQVSILSNVPVLHIGYIHAVYFCMTLRSRPLRAKSHLKVCAVFDPRDAVALTLQFCLLPFSLYSLIKNGCSRR